MCCEREDIDNGRYAREELKKYQRKPLYREISFEEAVDLVRSGKSDYVFVQQGKFTLDRVNSHLYMLDTWVNTCKYFLLEQGEVEE